MCLVLYVAFGLLRLNDLSLYTDSSRYVIWGTSFGKGDAFIDETQPEPSRYVVNAPLYAVILSPILVFVPLSITAAKIWTLLGGAIFLTVFFNFLQRMFSRTSAVLAVAILAFNPLLLVISTEVLSETPFLVFLFVVLLLFEKMEERGRYGGRDAVILGAILSLLPLLREIGFALVVALLSILLFKRAWKLSAGIAFGSLICFGAWTLINQVLIGVPGGAQEPNTRFITEHFVTPQSSPFLQETFVRFLAGVKQTSLHLGGMLFYPMPDVLIDSPTRLFRSYYFLLGYARYIIPVFFLPLFMIGMAADLRKGRTGWVRFIFLIFYLTVVLIYPVLDIRFLLPVLPFMLFYAMSGGRTLWRRWLQGRPFFSWKTTSFVTILVLLPNALTLYEILGTNRRYNSNPEAFYESLKSSKANKPIFTLPWTVMGEWIRTHTEETAVIASPFKEISTFIGPRKMLELNHAVPTTFFEQHLRDHAVEYLLTSLEQEGGPSYEFQMWESRRFQFVFLARVSGLALFQVRPTFHRSPADKIDGRSGIGRSDTLTQTSLRKIARAALMRERYDEAMETLMKAGTVGPLHAPFASERIIALAMSGRVREAVAELRILFSLPQSTAFLSTARRHIDIAQEVAKARMAANKAMRSFLFLEAVLFYHSHGYLGKAWSLIRELLQEDPAHVDALVWGWQIALEHGDTTEARRYLNRARSVNWNHSTVLFFHKIDSLFTSLAHARGVSDRISIHLEIAHIYTEANLAEEALDEAERAIGTDPGNPRPWRYLGELFESRSHRNAATKAFEEAKRLEPAIDRVE